MKTKGIKPEAVKTFEIECKRRREEILSDIKNGYLTEIKKDYFPEYANDFIRETLSRWCAQKRYDELIEYINSGGCVGGDNLVEFWRMKVLPELRKDNEGEKAFKVFKEYLSVRKKDYKREKKHYSKLAREGKFSYMYQISLAITIGGIMSDYCDYISILEDKDEDKKDKEHIEKIKKEISELIDIDKEY